MSDNLTLYQNDERWKDKFLGFDNESTLGKFGCLLTSLAMVSNAFGADVTPESLNEKMKAAGAFQGPWVRAFMIGSALPNVKYVKNVESQGDLPAPMAEVDAYLASGKPVIVEVDYAPDPGIQNHWIVIYAKQGDDYLIRDPWKGAKSSATLVQKYGFAGGPAQIINRVIFLDGAPVQGATTTSAAPPATPKPVTSPPPPAQTSFGPGFVVMSNVDALTLRSQPQISNANVIRRLSANSKLLVLEQEASAKAKIGVKDQWLKVRDIEGREGYVAAWYVTPAQEPALGVRPAATGPKADPPKKLTVRTTAESVTLRSRPVVAADTQLKLLPMNSELLVTETGSPESKIGAQNQWLKVRDIQGTEGYVAAWYVKKG
ncbi:MAG: SH3 domain-containing protein [Anaerolineales bacterium]